MECEKNAQMMESDSIDFVVPWVDGNDPKWKKQKDEYSQKPDNKARSRDWEQMQYWFRGVEKFAPWVRKIYFVTWGHLPVWLNTDNEKLVIIRHEDYLDEEYRPTFNSHTLELNLFRIEGLSERFVYFNDDTFIINHMKPDDFFHNGLPRMKCSLAALSCNNPTNVFEQVLFNDMRLINRKFNSKDFITHNWSKLLGTVDADLFLKNLLMLPFNTQHFTGFRAYHLPNPFLKSTFEALWAWPEALRLLELSSREKFRSPEQVNQYLAAFWQMASGQFYQAKKSIRGGGKYFEIGNQTEEALQTIRNQSCQMICLNDVGVWTEEEFETIKEKANKVFNTILPNKSSFEK